MPDRAAPSDEALARAHERLLQDHSLQFDRVSMKIPEPPEWLRWLGEALEKLAPVLKWTFWIALGLLVALILYFIARELMRLGRPRARADKPVVLTDGEWRPDAQAARDLLAEADALAARGLYAEAAHVLLLRSVQDIEKRQPRALRVSLTTREIAALKALPEAARPAFAAIGRVVERSLFGGAPVGEADFADCRQAYEAFALPAGWAG
jgi:hypothetical protein